MTGVQVNVKNFTKAYDGLAYDGIPSMSPHKDMERLITLRIGSAKHFPTHVSHHGVFEVMADWKEVLVYLAAHEAMHIHQYRTGTPVSEAEATMFGARCLRRYQKEHPE